MCGIQVFAGTPRTFFSTLVQVLPPSRVTCSRPSSEPAQITPRCTRARRQGDQGGEVLGAGDVRSEAAGLACFCHSGLSVVRSGLIIVQVSPRSVDLWTYWLPK